MKRRRKTIIPNVVVLGLLAVLSAFAADGDKTQVKGMIVSRTGETLIVSKSGETFTVMLTDDTKTKDNKGLFGLRKEYMADTVLIPGLKVQIDGVSDDQGRVIAKTITVDGDDLETAEMIQAGLRPTKEQVATNTADIQENTDRFSALSDYDVKAQATVKFDVGSSEISSSDQDQLKDLAQTATDIKGYIIEVKGFADSSGDAKMNQELSEDRAEAVVGYLIQQCNIPVRHIVAPGAMGEYQPAASNETAEGRAQNRRVEVKVLVNKGISGT
jgi:OmpA-OmpF porin, OOP family